MGGIRVNPHPGIASTSPIYKIIRYHAIVFQNYFSVIIVIKRIIFNYGSNNAWQFSPQNFQI